MKWTEEEKQQFIKECLDDSVTDLFLKDSKQNQELENYGKTFEEECAEGRFEFNPNRSFEERCEIVRRTAITRDMTYEERLAAQKRRYGL